MLLTVAGNQLPVIPLVETVGKIGATAPLQMAATGVNIGVLVGFTDIVILVTLAHCPAFGVKV